MTNNKVKKTAQKMSNEFRTIKDDAVLYDAYVEDINNILNIAKSSSRGWKELSVKLSEYLRDVKEYFETQFKGQEDVLSLEYKSEEEGIINITVKFHGKSLIRTAVCKNQF